MNLRLSVGAVLPLVLSACATIPTAPTAPTTNSAAVPAMRATYAQAPQAPLPGPPSGVPVIVNNGFEQWSNPDCPDQWTCTQHVGKKSFTFARDTAILRGGSASLRIQRVGDEHWGGAQTYIHSQRFVPGRIRVTAQVRLDKVDGEGAGLAMIVEGNTFTGEGSNQSRYIKGTSDWQQIELIAKVGPSTSALRIGVNLEGSGTAWFDDVKVELLP